MALTRFSRDLYRAKGVEGFLHNIHLHYSIMSFSHITSAHQAHKFTLLKIPRPKFQDLQLLKTLDTLLFVSWPSQGQGRSAESSRHPSYRQIQVKCVSKMIQLQVLSVYVSFNSTIRGVLYGYLVAVFQRSLAGRMRETSRLAISLSSTTMRGSFMEYQ